MPTPLDCCELGWLIVVDVIAGQMAEEELHRNEEYRQIKTHAQHDLRFGREFAPQQVPGTGRGDTGGAGEVRSEKHVRETHPDDRAEQYLCPDLRNEYAVLHHVTDRNLHPAVVDHDPEGGKRGPQSDHG